MRGHVVTHCQGVPSCYPWQVVNPPWSRDCHSIILENEIRPLTPGKCFILLSCKRVLFQAVMVCRVCWPPWWRRASCPACWPSCCWWPSTLWPTGRDAPWQMTCVSESRWDMQYNITGTVHSIPLKRGDRDHGRSSVLTQPQQNPNSAVRIIHLHSFIYWDIITSHCRLDINILYLFSTVNISRCTKIA